jgi:predicted acyltransferase
MQTAPPRFVALDVFRGVAIGGMVFVNMAGSDTWPQLRHAAWNGFTLADLVFPMFLFAVGASVAVSRTPSPSRVVRRVVVLAGLGIALNWLTVPESLRLPGVLQRIAFVYVVVLLVTRLPAWMVGVVTALLLAAYLYVLLRFGTSPVHALPARVDRAVFGREHLLLRWAYDPEGLLSSVASVSTALVGWLVARWTVRRPPQLRTAGWLLATGALVGVVAWELSSVVPYNKQLWSPSFALLTAGISTVVLGGLVVLVGWRPLRALTQRPAALLAMLGANALLVYTASELAEIGMRHMRTPDGPCLPTSCRVVDAHAWLNDHVFTPLAGARVGSLAFSATMLGALWVVAVVCHRARVVPRA